MPIQIAFIGGEEDHIAHQNHRGGDGIQPAPRRQRETAGRTAKPNSCPTPNTAANGAYMPLIAVDVLEEVDPNEVVVT